MANENNTAAQPARNPRPIPYPETLSESSVAAFARITRFHKVAVLETEITEATGISGDDIEVILDDLASADLLVRWTISDDHPTRLGYSGPAVTFSPRVAQSLGLRLDRYATHWVPMDTREKSVKVARKQLGFGLEVVCETDLKVDPPGILDNQIDPNAVDPAEELPESDILVRDAERNGGYTRPTFIVGSRMSWPVAQQDRGPLAPNAGLVPDGHKPLGKDAPGPCGGCGGKIGPDTCCIACDLYSADHLLPKMERLAAMRATKQKAGKKGGKADE